MMEIAAGLVKATIDVIIESVNASKERKAELEARLEQLYKDGVDAMAKLRTSHESEHQATLDAFAEARKRLLQP